MSDDITFNEEQLQSIDDAIASPKEVEADAIEKPSKGNVLSQQDHDELGYELEMEEKHGDSDLRTFIESGLSSASFGISDQLLIKSGLVSEEDMRERRRRNEVAAATGEIAGVVVPAIVSGGTSVGAKAASAGIRTAAKAGVKAEQMVTKKLLSSILKESGQKKITEEALRKMISKTAGSAVEGAIYGAGQLIKEEALGEADFNAENLVGHLGTGAILGGVAGGAFSGVESVVPVFNKAGTKVKGFANKKLKGVLDPIDNMQDLQGMTPSQKAWQLKNRPDVAQHAPEMFKELAKKKGLNSFGSIKKYHTAMKEFMEESGDDIGKVLDEMDAMSTKQYHVPKTEFNEVSTEEFFNKINRVRKEGDLYRANIDKKPVELYRDARTYMSPDKKSGYAIMPDGELVSVFSLAKKGSGRGDDVVASAVSNGARHGNAYDIDGFLPKLYGRHGGVITNRSAFAEEFADKTNKLVMKKKPDYIEFEFRRDFMPMESQLAGKVIDGLENLKHRLKLVDDKGNVLKSKTSIASIKKINEHIKMWEKDLLEGKVISAKELNKLKTHHQKLANWAKSAEKLNVQEQIDREISESIRREVLDIADYAGGDVGTRLRKHMLDYGTATQVLGNFSRKMDKMANKDFFGLRDMMLGGMGHGVFGGPAGGMLVVGAKKFAESDLKRKIAILSDIERSNQFMDKKIMSGIKNFFSNKTSIKTALPVKALMASGFAYKQNENGKAVKPKNRREGFKNIAENLQAMSDHNTSSKYYNRGNIQDAAPNTHSHSQLLLSQAVSFLDSKIPKEASLGSSFAHIMKKWEPSEVEMSKFERYLKAVENPMSVVEDLEKGMVSREGAEALQSVYPNIFQRIQSQVMEKIAENPEALDYQKRLKLGIILDIPADASLVPENISALQQHYSEAQESQAGGSFNIKPDKLDMAQSTETDMQRVAKSE